MSMVFAYSHVIVNCCCRHGTNVCIRCGSMKLSQVVLRVN